jgi:hypothetical protein
VTPTKSKENDDPIGGSLKTMFNLASQNEK